MLSINEQVVELIKTYPIDGTHKYHWIDGFDGVTRDLTWKGSIIAKAEEGIEKRTYCCGLTFEVWFRVMSQIGLNQLSPQDIKRIKADWFVATGKRRGPEDALVPRGLGKEILLASAKSGDFMQIWRTSGSGHSVIYLSHDAHSLTYWSTQPITNGIGKRTEKMFEKNGINEVYIARAI